MVEQVAPGSWRVSAELSTRDWSEAFGKSLPADLQATLNMVKTVGGLVMARLGRAAKVGDEVTIGNLVLSVEQMEGRRIETVTVHLTDMPGNTESEDGSEESSEDDAEETSGGKPGGDG